MLIYKISFEYDDFKSLPEYYVSKYSAIKRFENLFIDSKGIKKVSIETEREEANDDNCNQRKS